MASAKQRSAARRNLRKARMTAMRRGGGARSRSGARY